MSRSFHPTKYERRTNSTDRIAEPIQVAKPVHIVQKPKIMTLNINNIKMADYQRKPSMVVVQKIIDEYSVDRDRPIELSFRDGHYWCFDGQHRTRAHQLMGHNTISAQVHFGLTYEQEAALFAKQHQNERKVAMRELWDAAVKAGDEYPEVKEIIELCNAEGFEISTQHAPLKSNVISCPHVIQKIYRKHGKRGLKDILFVIKTAWPDMPSNTHNELFAGFLKMMDTFNMGDDEWNRLRDRLATITPDKFLVKANTHTGRGGKNIAILMATMYNKNLRSEKSRLDIYRIH